MPTATSSTVEYTATAAVVLPPVTVASGPVEYTATAAVAPPPVVATSPPVEYTATAVPVGASALAGDLVQLTVPAGATVTLGGVNPTPTLSGSGTLRSFTAPIVTVETVVTVTVVAGGVTSTGNVAVARCVDRIRLDGAWLPAYRTVGPFTARPPVPLTFA